VAMNAKTLKALEGSIKKWEAIVAGTGEDKGADNCPLCRVFIDPFLSPDTCGGCPVRERTGSRYCSDSPYDAWAAGVRRDYSAAVVNRGGGKRIASTPKLVALAQAELDFLRSLLPESRP
nr:hypothetical protein [Armatimonadota bacterium]